MKLTAKLAKTKYDHNKDSITHLLVELEAPKVEWKKERAPICVIPVLDVSGSMFGPKIDYLQKACRKFLDHLCPGDFAGIVAFDSQVHEIAPIVEITQHQKDRLKKKISELKAGSCTNTSGGLIQAFKWIKEMDLPKNVVLRVILFTDGHANVGISGRELIDFVKNHKGKASVSAFGFGSDCDQELLADISNTSDGNYAFIDSPDAALTAFARELGGLMSTFAQDINVQIIPDKNNEVLEILNDEDVEDNEGTAAVRLRDILGEEKKWIVVQVKLQEVEKAFPRKVNAFKVQVNYKDKDGEVVDMETLSVKTKFCKPGEEPKEEDAEVVRQRDRLLASKAQDEAEAYARTGNFSMAQSVMDCCFASMSDADTKKLVGEISVNYSASNYGETRGVSNSVRKSLKGKRAYGTDVQSRTLCSTAGAQSNAAMDEMESNFQSDEDWDQKDAVNQTVTVNGSSSVTFDPSHYKIEDPSYYADSRTVNKSKTEKKRSDRDW